MEKIIFTKYSNERAREFCIRTDICETEDGERFVRKKACYPEGEAHVARLGEWYRRLEEVYRGTPISMNRIIAEEDGISFEYLKGKTLEEQLDTMLSCGDVEGAVEQLLKFADIVRQSGRTETFTITGDFRKIFGEVNLPDGLFCAPVTDLDMIVGNAFVEEDGWTMMDYEWSFDFPIPVNYVIFRILHFYIYGNTSRAVLYSKNLYGRAGLDREEVRQYEKMEEHFQQYVLGEHVPLRFLYPEMNPGCIDFRSESCRNKIREICNENRLDQQKESVIQLCVDCVERTDEELEIKGWSFNEELQRPEFTVTDTAGREIKPERLEFFMRRDVNAGFGVEDARYEAGFDLIIRLTGRQTKRWGEKYILTIRVNNRTASYTVNLSRLAFKNSRLGRKLVEMRFGPHVAGTKYFSQYEMGVFGESKKFRKEDQGFSGWRLATQLSEKELKRQREEKFSVRPLISIVIPLYNTPQQYLKAMLDSALEQTYTEFELCLADGSDSSSVGDFVREQYHGEKRIRYKKLAENRGISENTNEALAMAEGEYVMLADHDDLLAPNALYEIVKVINQHSDADIIYTDEDKVDMEGERYSDPHFKPDFNLYMLRSSNYICHIFVVRRQIAEMAGGFRKEFDGAQDYDFILKCCERAKGIYHVPRILYHWRTHEGSTAANPESKVYAWEAGRRALEAHYRRLGLETEVTLAELFGRYRTKWQIQGSPLISVLIPNKDHSDDLLKCLQSVYRKSTYRNFEVIVVENNSKEPKTFAVYKELPEKFPGTRVITREGEFNFSAVNNQAAREAKGEYLLLLNNDTEVLEPHWLEELLGICQQPEVGAVGAKLFYPDGTIQHAGVILGLGGPAGHIFAGMLGDKCGYAARANTMQNLSAVTAACMMTKRSIYEEVGGMDEKLGVALNDVDYCMKLTSSGKQVVYTPYAQLSHNESVTRGPEDNQKKKTRFQEETRYFEKKWQDILKNGDPYYNPNLSRVNGECSLRIPEP
ncbi:MAG: glycosyltransferase family 2 protein [Lachnospiraceae bacterium]|nr:glycosyltransferase family 2 protein [Lachnospiraceae bacterium]